MSGLVTRYPNRHRSAPMREGFVLPCKRPAFSAHSQRRIRSVCSDNGHLSDVIVRLIGLVVKLNGRIKTQIPIGRCLF
jgi:hypothetical protein